MLCPQQALLFAGERGEQLRAPRRLGGSHGLRRFQQDRHAQRVVDRAVVDGIAIAQADDAHVVQVCGMHHVLVGQGRIAAGQPADHVVGIQRLDPGTALDHHRRLQVERVPLAGAGALEHLGRGAPGCHQQLVGLGHAHRRHRLQLREPVHREAFRIAQAHGGLVPRGLHAGPGQARFELRRGHDHRAHRAAVHQSLHLLPRGRMESAGVMVERVRRARHQHRDAAAQVYAGEIIVAEPGGVDGMAHEHRLRADRMAAGVEVGPWQEVIAEAQLLHLSFALHRQPRAFAQRHSGEQRYALEPGAVITAGRQPGLGHARGHQGRRALKAPGTGFASLHGGIRQPAQVGFDPLRGGVAGLRHRIGLRGQRGGRCGIRVRG